MADVFGFIPNAMLKTQTGLVALNTMKIGDQLVNGDYIIDVLQSERLQADLYSLTVGDETIVLGADTVLRCTGTTKAKAGVTIKTLYEWVEHNGDVISLLTYDGKDVTDFTVQPTNIVSYLLSLSTSSGYIPVLSSGVLISAA